MIATQYDLDIWARTIWGEARGENVEGRRAVAYVIQNRHRELRWPNTIAGVCLQPKQFSCWNAGDPNLHKIIELRPTDDAYLECLHAALSAGLFLGSNPIDRANHYAALGTDPYWAEGKPPQTVIGRHQFWTL